ncbi:MAG: iron-sulfur cluster assembly accessory protein [Chroococcidiopsidaceae cyanobacterium CP_BM_ER_R8_30]|nr:iron-sulfur cluster assembly accessory protein [Chroococcidiopsidaceae cyanobacterium CP_BM_ER_R8_30]
MIQITPAAASEIKRLLSKQRQPNNNNVLFRLRVLVGGCSGLFYDMRFDVATELGDRAYNSMGISIVVDAQSWNYINNLTLDYSEDLMGGGFRFHNPDAEQVCGCGNSFSHSLAAVIA